MSCIVLSSALCCSKKAFTPKSKARVIPRWPERRRFELEEDGPLDALLLGGKRLEQAERARLRRCLRLGRHGRQRLCCGKGDGPRRGRGRLLGGAAAHLFAA